MWCLSGFKSILIDIICCTKTYVRRETSRVTGVSHSGQMPRVNITARAEFSFFSPVASEEVLGLTQSSVRWVPGSSFLGGTPAYSEI